MIVFQSWGRGKLIFGLLIAVFNKWWLGCQRKVWIKDHLFCLLNESCLSRFFFTMKSNYHCKTEKTFTKNDVWKHSTSQILHEHFFGRILPRYLESKKVNNKSFCTRICGKWCICFSVGMKAWLSGQSNYRILTRHRWVEVCLSLNASKFTTSTVLSSHMINRIHPGFCRGSLESTYTGVENF